MLAGRRALITGATSGIGEATARLFVKEGAHVIATGRNVDKLKELQAQLKCSIVAGDVAKDGECERIVAESAQSAPGSLIDTLVNCAGVLQGGAFGTPACSLENLMYNFNTNTKGVFEMMQHSVPLLKEARAGGANPSIVNVSSVNGEMSFGGVTSYCVSKAATEMLMKCAALDLSEHGIRVNGVNPGLVITELQKRGGLNDAQYEALVTRSIETTHPLGKALGRVATPEEVADLIAYLASDKAGFITGASVTPQCTMPMSHASPARVPNFAYDTGSRDLTLLDSVVQKDMARTKRVANAGVRVKPYAVDTGRNEAAPVRVSKKVITPRPSQDWVPQHVATRRTNHMQNAPSQLKEPRARSASRVNSDSDPLGSRGERLPASTTAPMGRFSSRQTRINHDSNIFGPSVPAYTRPPPPKRESFSDTFKSGHIRSTLPGQTDASKFGGYLGSKFY